MSKNLISKATLYRAEFPASLDVEMALENRPYEPPQGTTPTSVGFVPTGETESVLAPFAGGFAFTVRIGDKVVPGSTLKTEVAKVVAHIEKTEGRKPGRREMKDIKAEVHGSLLMRALVKESTLVGYYHIESGFLILNNTSQRLCDLAMTHLVRAVDTFKTTTIHVSVNAGLTTRLRDWLVPDEGELAFGDFQPNGKIALASPDKRTLNIKTDTLLGNTEALTEAIRAGYQVKSMGLANEASSFVLSDKFKFSQIVTVADSEDEPDEQTWATQAFMEVTELVGVAKALCEMLGFKDDDQE